MHFHNWLIVDDAAVQQMIRLVQTWQCWGVKTSVQVQLISLLTVFNGKAVGDQLEKCANKTELPIQSSQLMLAMFEQIQTFIAKVLADGRNPFSIRFRLSAHNSCKVPSSTKAHACVAKLKREILLGIEADSLAECRSYTEKLKLLSRTKGYSDCLERSFLGKNLVNVLSTLGKRFEHLAAHVLDQTYDHPNGSGAEAFLRLGDAPMQEEKQRATLASKGEATLTANAKANQISKECTQMRTQMVKRLQTVWPKNVLVNGQALPDLHLGKNELEEASHETVQFGSCQGKRTVNYVLTARIPAHLVRNKMVAELKKRKPTLRKSKKKNRGAKSK